MIRLTPKLLRDHPDAEHVTYGILRGMLSQHGFTRLTDTNRDKPQHWVNTRDPNLSITIPWFRNNIAATRENVQKVGETCMQALELIHGPRWAPLIEALPEDFLIVEAKKSASIQHRKFPEIHFVVEHNPAAGPNGQAYEAQLQAWQQTGQDYQQAVWAFAEIPGADIRRPQHDAGTYPVVFLHGFFGLSYELTPDTPITDAMAGLQALRKQAEQEFQDRQHQAEETIEKLAEAGATIKRDSDTILIEHPSIFNNRIALPLQGTGTWHGLYRKGFMNLEIAAARVIPEGGEQDAHPLPMRTGGSPGPKNTAFDQHRL